ncbi:hypothetical protein A2U01_0043235, partial [Trifolium medium]|nr:hypothetical protein [Trifolium medium]
FKVCESPFKVVFGSGTKFTKDDSITNIPPHEFHFKRFKEVQDGKFKINILYGRSLELFMKLSKLKPQLLEKNNAQI